MITPQSAFHTVHYCIIHARVIIISTMRIRKTIGRHLLGSRMGVRFSDQKMPLHIGYRAQICIMWSRNFTDSLSFETNTNAAETLTKPPNSTWQWVGFKILLHMNSTTDHLSLKDQFLAPLKDALSQSKHTRKCPSFSDEDKCKWWQAKFG